MSPGFTLNFGAYYMRRRTAFIALLCILGLAISCGDEGGTGPNLPPTTSIVSLELLQDQKYRAHIAWNGSDPDGRVSYYEVAWRTGQVMLGASLLEDGLTWEKVTVSESTFTLNADVCTPAGACSSYYTFFVRAVDNGGAVDTNPPYESFTTSTLLPEAWFVSPSPPTSTEPTCLNLTWNGDDPDGEVVAYRYCKKRYYDPPAGLPYPDWDSRWSPWTAEKGVLLPDESPVDEWNPWTFFLQAKDNAGAVQQVFRSDKNILIITIDEDLTSGPSITMRCYKGPCLGKLGALIASRSTSNPANMDVPVDVFEGDTLCFKSFAEPGYFATALTGVQYTLTPGPSIYWKSPGDSAAWYYPRYGDLFIAPGGEFTLYIHVKDNYCQWGSQASAHMVVRGNPAALK
jgi:hypothetical protein